MKQAKAIKPQTTDEIHHNLNYSLSVIGKRVLLYKFKYGGQKNQFKFLLQSDVHFDNPKCRRDLFFYHLDQAVQENALVLFNGDTICGMQGRDDPRASKCDLLPENMDEPYHDSLVNVCSDYLEKYAKNIAFIGRGNHEQVIKKRKETDLAKRLRDKLSIVNPNLGLGGYSGWIVLHFEHESGGKVRRFYIWYHHGWGGGGPVTKGVIQNNRVMSYVKKADCLWMGHVHEYYYHVDRIETINQNLEAHCKDIHILRTSTYKEEYESASEGFHIERGGFPKPLGGAWLEIDLREHPITKEDLLVNFKRAY